MPTAATSLWTQDFPYFDFPHALVYAAGYLWVGNESSTGSLVRVDPANPTAWTHLTFDSDGKHGWVVDTLYIPSKNKIYCLMGTPNNTVGWTDVAEVDPTTLATTDVIQTSTYNVEQGSFDCDGTYLYIASRNEAIVRKYDIATWSLVSSLTTNVSLQHCIRYDGVGKLYVTSSDINTGLISIAEITTSSFTVTKSVVINHDRVLTDDLTITPSYLFLGSEQTGKLLRVSRSNFNDVTTIATGIAARNFGVYYDGVEVWTGWEGAPGIFGRLNPSTLALQTYQFAGANQSSPNEFLHVGNVMYFTHYHINGTLTAMGVAGTIPSPTPGAILVSDTITLSDRASLIGSPAIEIEIVEAIALQDRLFASTFANPGATDAIAISDRVVIDYLGLNDFSDTLTVGDSFGVWNTTYFDEITLSDDCLVSFQTPLATVILREVADRLELFDSIAATFPNNQFLFGDSLFLDDALRIILRSTDNAYLRRYLNDTLSDVGRVVFEESVSVQSGSLFDDAPGLFDDAEGLFDDH